MSSKWVPSAFLIRSWTFNCQLIETYYVVVYYYFDWNEEGGMVWGVRNGSINWRSI